MPKKLAIGMIIINKNELFISIPNALVNIRGAHSDMLSLMVPRQIQINDISQRRSLTIIQISSLMLMVFSLLQTCPFLLIINISIQTINTKKAAAEGNIK